MTMLDVAVIGGGQAGLALGYHLKARDLTFEILDAGTSIGHVWRSRWDSLRLFTPAQYASLPGLSFPAAPDTYPTKDQVADYLQTYVDTVSLPIRLNTRVTALRRDSEHDGYLLSTIGATIAAHNVVVATGPFQTPFIPPVSTGLADEVTQLHSSAYRNPDQLPPGPVLVVGGGNSGFQIAAELAAARPVDLAIGTRNVTVPQRILGRDIFWWQTITGLIGAPASSRRGQWMRRGEGTVIGLSTRDLRRAGVTLRPRLVRTHDDHAVFADNTTLPVPTVIWATGFHRDHSWINIPEAIDDRGSFLHSRGISPVAGLYTLGQPWQRTAGSALLGFVQHDAAHLADHITAYRSTQSGN
ncbi:pyridine nucleotide-disulfide oxidoreductase [Actinosynnema sp. ALI-1.44]|uniref:flavin-containing monooxygenase n=1 Tax=Actinosynnema sp. ALI-1.44 TaxID=1933779 RepID=UPI00097C06E6|nr:NAD(P)-binding domain-containing protein [Actinosynnema sp. ALI-1.44]ONI85365.1 pyridine nucleotide-disulfide oxidoreductase [Actinosynnema sp. ALI-1.44]